MKWMRAHRFLLFLLISIVLNLVLYGAQPLYYLYGAPADDGLMIRAATEITKREWLGAYTEFTLAKGCFYPLWIVFLNFLNLPLPLGTQALYLLSCLAVIYALRPLVRSDILSGGLFLLLIFNPASISPPLLRIYREGVTPALCMLLVAWMMGIYARAGSMLRGLRILIPYVLCGVFALPAWWFVREDAFWLLPLIFGGFALTGYTLWKKREGVRSALRYLGVSLLPFASLLLCGLLLAWTNFQHYGSFLINDYSGGTFTAAYGAVTRITQEDWQPRIPVNETARALAYAQSPTFAELAPYLDGGKEEGNEQIWKNIGKENEGVYDYDGGHFFWALRTAAASLGYYETPAKATAYFSRMEEELTRAFQDGKLSARAGRRTSLSAPFDVRYVEPTLLLWKEAANYLVRLEGLDVSPAVSVQYGDADILEYREVERLTNSNFLLDTSSYPLRIQLRATGFAGRETLHVRIEDIAGKNMTLYEQQDMQLDDVFVFLLEDYQPIAEYTLFVQEGDRELCSLPLRDTQPYTTEVGLVQVEKLSAYGQIPKDEEPSGTDWMKEKINAIVLAGYQAATPILCIVALLGFIGTTGMSLFSRFRKRSRWQTVCLRWITCGVLLMVAARLFMLAFVEASSFDAISVLYLSSVYPLLFLGLGLALISSVSAVRYIVLDNFAWFQRAA